MKRALSLLLAAALAAALLIGPASAASPLWVQVDGQGTAGQTITLRGLSGSFDSVQITLTLDRAPTGFQFAPALSGGETHTALTVSGNSITLYATSRNQINQGDAILLGVLTADSAFRITAATGVKLLDLEAGGSRELAYATVGVGSPTAALPFTDVPEHQWYHDAVAYVYAAQLMNGTGGTLFEPDKTTTRGMIVTILWRLEGEPVVNYLMPFTDVPASWYTEAVRWASSERIVNGYTDGTFRPEAAITREQLATILFNYAKYKGYDVSGRASLSALFPDAGRVSGYAADALSWANQAKLINGVASGGATFLQPQGSAIRAQVAAILMRFQENIAK